MTSGRPPTLDDVARAAGVHKATASRALNPATRHQVSARTAYRVSLEATRLGYVPNTLARGLRTSRTAAVGVLIPDLTNPLFPPIVRGIQDRLEQHGYTALLVNTDGDEARERAEFNALRSRRVEGFIVATARRHHPLLELAVRERIPFVTVNRSTELPTVPAVLGDDADGVAQAVAHLRALDHTRLAHLAGPQTLSTGYVRMRAFRAAAPGAAVVECASYTEAAGYDAARLLFERHPHTTAVLAGNDLIALGTLRAIEDLGRCCPADVSVVGFNDMPFADRFRPPLTTVHVPHHLMGVQAAQLLLDHLRAAAPSWSILLPARLVVRGSTARRRPGPT
jgi:LacI family transcriptional regulator